MVARPRANGTLQNAKEDRVRETVIGLRKQNLSIYDISRALKKQGEQLSPVAVPIRNGPAW